MIAWRVEDFKVPDNYRPMWLEPDGYGKINGYRGKDGKLFHESESYCEFPTDFSGCSIFACRICGETKLSFNYFNSRVCYKCSNQIAQCRECGEIVGRDDLAWDNPPVCVRCAHQCEDCGDVINPRDVWNFDDRVYCRNCYHNTFTECSNCGRTLYRDDEDGCECGGAILHRYDYRPDWQYYGNSPYYGIELETDDYTNRTVGLKALRDLDSEEDHFFSKLDGSLNNGIEIVFHPRSIDNWFEDDTLKLLSRVTGAVQVGGGKSFNTGTCGIHVHRENGDIDSDLTTSLLFFFRKCQEQIETLSQRKELSYASFGFVKGVITKKHAKDLVERRDHRCDRYQCLNFENRNTIEFRVFKGTLRVVTFLCYISFCHYIIEFLKQVEINESCVAHPWSCFTGWLQDQPAGKPLDALKAYLDKKGILKQRLRWIPIPAQEAAEARALPPEPRPIPGRRIR